MTREHIEHILAALGFLAFALFISYFNSGPVHLTTGSKATSTLVPVSSGASPTTFEGFSLASPTLDGIFPVEGQPATTTTPTKSPAKPAKVATSGAKAAPIVVPSFPSLPITKPAPTPTPVAASSTQTTPPPAATNDTDSSAWLKGSIVNIICISHNQSLHGISGSGVIIDSRGIILTVAHVAQMMLLQQYLGSDEISCTVRTGSPAKSQYLAQPIYVSNSWLTENPTTLISSQPTGTGEHDVALLAITASVTSAALPSTFQALMLADSSPSPLDDVTLGTYGAQELSSSQVRTALYPTIATASVLKFYGFGTASPDVFSMSGNAAAQEGSSGGAVVDRHHELVGIVTTSEISGPVSERHVDAITTSYIEREFGSVTGKNFSSYITGGTPQSLANAYAATALSQGEDLAKAIGLEK